MTLFLVTGASGVGKTTISNKVEHWKECISHTTRPMRKGEVEGKTYYYISKAEFEAMILRGEFVEITIYDGNYYGLSRNELDENSQYYPHLYVIVEYNGYKQIKKQYPNAVGIFLHMSKEECLNNMLLRGDTLEKATARISKYDEEMSNRNEFDYVIKNVQGKMDYTASVIRSIINSYN